MRATLITFAVVLVVTSMAFGEIPQYTSYQGRVTDNSGVPVADGSYNMRFRIYDAETGGTMEWDSGTHSEQVEGGVFNVLLGESPHPTLDLDFDEDYWLLVTFDGVNQSPRQRLTSAGYAYMASGLVPGTLVQGSPFGAVVTGYNTRTATSSCTGLQGIAAATTGIGVGGAALAGTGTTYGVYGLSYSDAGRGVYGEAPNVGVRGYASATTDYAYGGWFESASNQGSGVRAYATSTTGDYATYGVYGRSHASCDGSIGVYGRSSYNNNYGATWGVYGRSDGHPSLSSGTAAPIGVYGYQSQVGTLEANKGYGGYFVSNAEHSGTGVEGRGPMYGVRGVATGVGTNYAVWGYSESGSWAGYFSGDVNVTGDITKANCYFLIDHPLDPENKLLRHTCVESPENLLIYRGTVKLNADGEAVVELPSYFEALTDEVEASVHLTPHGKPFLTGYDWQSGHTAFTVYGSPDREVSWMALAERDDPVARQHVRPVEEDKGPDNKVCDRGELLYPTAYGYPETMGRDYETSRRPHVAPVEEPEDLRPTAVVERVESDRTSDDADVMEVGDAR